MFSIEQKLEQLIKEYLQVIPLPGSVQEKIDKKFRLEFNFNSNHLEGNTLSYDQTELLILFDETTGNHSFRELSEMKAHDAAFKLVKQAAADQDFQLTEQWIRELNHIILVDTYWKTAVTQDGKASQKQIIPGQYKATPNHVIRSNGEKHYYAEPADVPILMGEMMKWWNDQQVNSTMSVAANAAKLHYDFVAIHPFDDGNGRLARLLLNYVLLKNNLPPVVIKSIDKKNYFFALQEADRGYLDKFTGYVGEQLIWSLNIYLKAAKGDPLDEPGDLDKKLALFKQQLGHDPDAAVQYVKSPEAIGICFERALRPLAVHWDAMLKKFDALFATQNINIGMPGESVSRTTALKALNDLEKDVIPRKMDKKGHFGELTFVATLKNFRHSDGGAYNGGKAVVQFEPHFYRIRFEGSKNTFTKLYHESFKESELQSTFEEMGNWIFKGLEEQIERDRQQKK